MPIHPDVPSPALTNEATASPTASSLSPTPPQSSAPGKRPLGNSSSSPLPSHPSAKGHIGTTAFPRQRWQIAPPCPSDAEAIAHITDLSPLLSQVLINRGITTPDMATLFLNPDTVELPSPLEDFADLSQTLDYLSEAIAQQQKIAICGDYDADGMTSTALLMRALRHLGAQAEYAIPSRMQEGYGINERIVESFHAQGIKIILTVDNGIAAVAPIARAVELGMIVIVTDHHDVPDSLPPAQAILNPKLIATTSPYRGLAGVGVAYILALTLAQRLMPEDDVAHSAFGYMLLDLFTLGTIADLAPLTGVNRRWVQHGLKHLPQSQIPGVKALIQVAGLSDKKKGLKPEAIGFRLGPRINAVGRIADPITVIELLTTEDLGVALERAMACEQINQDRRRMCEVIEQEAIAHIQRTRPNLQQERVLVVVQLGWHHGVIGIVASRLVERYGVPVFIGTYEDEANTHIRGSARSIPEFDVHKALVFCDDSLEKYGGHRAAGGFTLEAAKLTEFRRRLQLFANMYLRTQHLLPLVNVDVAAQFAHLTHNLYEQIDRLHPCGIGNPDPVFWTPNVRVIEQKTVGKGRAHLKLVLQQDQENSVCGETRSSLDAGEIDATEIDTREIGTGETVSDRPHNQCLTAIAWRWGNYYPLPSHLDIAYQLKLNEWQGKTTVELEIVGVRLPASISSPHNGSISVSSKNPDTEPRHHLNKCPSGGVLNQPTKPVLFHYRQRQYDCSIGQLDDQLELRIRNSEGKVLAVQPHSHRAVMGRNRADAVAIDMTQPHYFDLIQAALHALETVYTS